MSDSNNIEKTTNKDNIEDDHKNQKDIDNDENRVLIKNGKEEKMPDGDLEKGTVMPTNKEKDYGRDEQTRLISYEELKQYRKSPLWRGLRFLLFGGLAFIFVALVTVAILIVMMSSKCEELPEGVGLVMPREEEQLPNVFPRQLTVLHGQEATFYCEFPTGPVEWRRLDPHGLFVEFPSGIEKTEDGQLKIPIADINHQGEFACQVKDESNTKNMNTPQVVRLFVLNQAIKENEEENPTITTRNGREELPPLALKPRVDSYLMIASAGEPVHFRCWNCQFADCRTSHRLVWQKVNSKNRETEILNSNGPLAIERDAQSVFMIFQEVRQSDAGIYECLDQGTGATSSQVHLQVEPPRTPVIIPMNQTVNANTTALIHCTVPGRTDAKLSWRLENGVEAEELTGVMDDGKGLLRIDHVRAEHVKHGYVCWAMYPKRADKQALHAGSAKVYVIGGISENDRKEEEAKGEVKKGWRIEEINEEIKEEKKEARSTKETIPESQTNPVITRELAEGKIKDVEEKIEETEENKKDIEGRRNNEDDEGKKKDEGIEEKQETKEELEEKGEKKMEEIKENKEEEVKEEKKDVIAEEGKKVNDSEDSLMNNNEDKAKIEEVIEGKKEAEVKEEKKEDVKFNELNDDEDKLKNVQNVEAKKDENKEDVEAGKDEINEAKSVKMNEESKGLEEKNKEVEEKREDSVEEKEEDKGEKKEDTVEKDRKEAINEEKDEPIEEKKDVIEEKNETVQGEREEAAEEKKEETIEEKKEDVIEQKKKEDDVEEKEESREEGLETNKKEEEEKKEETVTEVYKEKEGVPKEETDRKNKKEEEKREEDGVSNDNNEEKGLEKNEKKKEDEEVSGEATIQIEKLVHSISASGSKANETNIEKEPSNEVREVNEEETDNKNNSSAKDFWKVLDALMGILPM
ncbi:hypothetical protein ACQ4LE_004808 [Meloidogyne hapla]